MSGYNKESIVRYVEDELSAEEKQQFEADLRKDPSLRAEVALYRELKASLQERLGQDAQRDALAGTLQQMQTIYFGTDSRASISRTESPIAGAVARSPVQVRPRARQLRILLYGMTAAASVILVTMLLWPSGKADDIGRLGRTQMISATERGENADTLLQQASVYFNHEEFNKALPLLDKAVKADSSNQQALFYRGLSAWHTRDLAAARKDLERVYNNGSLLQYDAAFYIALSYAGENNKAAASAWLKKIPAGTPVSNKAKELEKRLQE
jgi:hypothetical protein